MKLPKYNEKNTPKSEYPSNWTRISNNYKDIKNWQCEKCGVYLSHPAHQKYLHTHHIDGVKAHTNFSNLRALCASCHQEEDLHGYMHVSNEAKQIILKQRKNQNETKVTGEYKSIT